MKRAIVIALVIATLAVVANDASRFATAQRSLDSLTYDLATSAAQQAQTGVPREVVGGQIAAAAQASGVTVYQYGQTEDEAQVWTRTTVPGTIVAGRISALLAGKPFAEAMRADLVIADHYEAGIR